MLVLARQIYGASCEAPDARVGTLYDVLFDDRTWTVRHLVLNAGGWLHGRQVLLGPDALAGADWPGRSVRLRLTKVQVEACPRVEADPPVARQESAASQVLVSEAYWMGALDGRPGGGGDPHLRSARLLAGLHVHCPDGRLGHVEDFLVDDRAWAVRHVLIDTRNWWPGKRVLIEPDCVHSIRWRDREVHLILSRDELERRPAFDGTLPSDESPVGTA